MNNEEPLWCSIFEAEFLRLVPFLGTALAVDEAKFSADAAVDAYLERFDDADDTDDTDEAGA